MRTDNMQPDVTQLVRLMASLPPPGTHPDAGKARREIMGAGMICMCGHCKHPDNLETINTGVFTIVSNVCRGCATAIAEDRKLARVVCCRCKQVVARMAPHKTKKGFEFVANTTYHIDKCAACHPGLEVSCILEEALFNERLK